MLHREYEDGKFFARESKKTFTSHLFLGKLRWHFAELAGVKTVRGAKAKIRWNATP